MMNKVLLLICSIVISSCIWNDIEHPNNPKKESFPFKSDGTEIDIYLIKSDVAKGTKPPGEIGKNDLEPTPWLSHSEIDFFDWSAKTFYLKNEKSKSSLAGRYFAVTANRKPLFTGFFYSGYMSYIPHGAIIYADGWMHSPKEIVVMIESWNRGTENSMNNTSVFRRMMEKSGLIKEGIHVELTDVDRINSSTLSYRYNITNVDLEVIYVLDPDKMTGPRFHYYTNGVHLTQGNSYFGASNFEYTASDKIEMGWLTRLAPRQSITRTLKLNGYKDLPVGKVIASFYFPGVILNENESWRMNNGRIWMGSFRAEKEIILK